MDLSKPIETKCLWSMTCSEITLAKEELFKVDIKELVLGLIVELEHAKISESELNKIRELINDASEVVIDHLKENPKYYSIIKDTGLTPEIEGK